MPLFLIFLLIQLIEKSFSILHGQDGYIEEFPFLVSVRNQDTHVCSGTILNARFILTAAHCVCYHKDDVFTIQYATTYISQNLDNVIPSIERICHPNFYSNTAAYDAAILRLENDLPPGKWKPVELLDRSLFTLFFAHDGRIAGWGQNSEFHDEPSEQLQKLDVQVLTNVQCFLKLRIFNGAYCSGALDSNRYSGACGTDDGGPLLIGTQQVGIISEEHPNNCESIENSRIIVYSKISYFYEWIQQNSNFFE